MTSQSPQMRQAVIASPTTFTINEAPIPELQADDEILLRTTVAGICSGDLMEWYLAKKQGTVFGHEYVGHAVAVGSAVDHISVGQRVFAHHHAPCGQCRYCHVGDPVQCATWRKSAVDPGGMAEYIRIPGVITRNDCFAIDDIEAEVGVFIEPLACSIKALRRGRVQPGQIGAIVGCGIMGMLNIAAAKALGASEIWAIDPDPWRREHARLLGATVCVSPDELAGESTQPGFVGADFVVVGPGFPDVINQSLNYVRPGGNVVLFTPTAAGVLTELDLGKLYFRDVSLIPSYSCGPEDTRLAYQLMRHQQVDPRPIITHRFPLARIQRAYDTAKAGGSALKVLITFS